MKKELKGGKKGPKQHKEKSCVEQGTRNFPRTHATGRERGRERKNKHHKNKSEKLTQLKAESRTKIKRKVLFVR